MEQGLAIGHGEIRGEDAPHHVRFQRGRGGAEQRGDARERVEIVVDQHLAGDAHHLAVGLDTVGLLGLSDAAALELAGLVDLLELRGFTELQALHRLEVGDRRPARNRLIGTRSRLIGITERPVGDARQDLREVGAGMERTGGDLIAAQTLHPDALSFEEAAGHFDEAEAPPFARCIIEAELSGLEAVEKSCLDGGAAGFGGIEVTGTHMRAGLDGSILGCRGIDEEATGLSEAGAALHEIIGNRLVNMKLAGCLVDPGDTGTLLGENLLRADRWLLRNRPGDDLRPGGRAHVLRYVLRNRCLCRGHRNIGLGFITLGFGRGRGHIAHVGVLFR